MNSIVGFIARNKGLFVGVVTILLFMFFNSFPRIADVVYRNFIFQIFRFLWDHTLNLIPFPLIYVLIPAVPLLLFYYFRNCNRTLKGILMRILNLTGIVFSLFMLMWGFNYSCSLIAPMSRIERLGKSELYQFGIEIAESINRLDPSIFEDAAPSSIDLALINRSVETQVKARGIKVWGQPAFHSLRLHGKLRKLGIAGIYFPFTGQAYADNTFLPSTLCFIRAHELSHAYGIASEAEADFISYLALYNCSVDTELHSMYYKFCADLELLRSIRYQLYMMDDSLRLEIDSRLDGYVLAELKAIKLNALEFPEYFPGLQSSVNDRYLKIMGVEEGVENYDLFIDLAWDYLHSAR